MVQLCRERPCARTAITAVQKLAMSLSEAHLRHMSLLSVYLTHPIKLSLQEHRSLTKFSSRVVERQPALVDLVVHIRNQHQTFPFSKEWSFDFAEIHRFISKQYFLRRLLNQSGPSTTASKSVTEVVRSRVIWRNLGYADSLFIPLLHQQADLSR